MGAALKLEEDKKQETAPAEEPRKPFGEMTLALASPRVLSDIRNLEKRLAELLEQDGNRTNKISFGFTVLSCVAHGSYERALAELDSVGRGLEDYPIFERKARRYVTHSKSLVSAIKVKHTIGMSANVNKAKQKELSDKIAEHFVDLKRAIITIEKIQKGVRGEDLSSTLMFFRTCFFSLLAIFLVYGAINLTPYLAEFDIDMARDFFSLEFPAR